VKTLTTLNNITNILLINTLIIQFIFLLFKCKKTNWSSIHIIILIFCVILVTDNWLSYFTRNTENFYYSFTASIFPAYTLTKNRSKYITITIIIVLGTLLLSLKSPTLVQISFCFSMIILFFEIKHNLLKSSKQRIVATVLIPITLFIYFIIQEYTFFQIGRNWANSNLLIYFSIGDYIVFTTMIIIINANLRRLFFN